MFAVRWLDEVRDLVNDMWKLADQKECAAKTDAVDVLIHKLRDNPEEQGESRDGDFRVTHQSPLGVRFHIDKEARYVTVTDVWRVHKRGT